MKKISGKWAIDISKLDNLVASITQPINFTIDNANYKALKIDINSNELQCFTDIWVKKNNESIDISAKAFDKYHLARASTKIDYVYPVYYGALDSEFNLDDQDKLTKLLIDKAEFEVNSFNIPEDHYLYICIPKAYDNGKLLFTINDAFGGIYLNKELELPVGNYIPTEYNIYKSTNHSLGDLHIIVSEKGLQQCLFM